MQRKWGVFSTRDVQWQFGFKMSAGLSFQSFLSSRFETKSVHRYQQAIINRFNHERHQKFF